MYVEDAEGMATMDETVERQMSVLRQQWHFYQKAFPPGIRIKASHDFIVERNVERIFDHVTGWASAWLPKPEQGGVISALRRAFATKLLYQSECRCGNEPVNRIVFERDYLRSYLGSDYFSPLKELLGATDFARLTAWLAETAREISFQPRPQAESTLDERVAQLETQLEQLKSVFEPPPGAKSENETLLDGLVAALLDRLVEATEDDPFAEYASYENYLVDDYCEFLWQKSIDEAIVRGGTNAQIRGADDWRRLEVMKKLSLVAMKVQSSAISRFRPAGWRRS